MGEELEVLKVVVDRLRTVGIEYMLTGSVAMAWYAQPRQTRDIDIVVELFESKLDQFVAAFSGDFYVDADVARAEVKRRGMFNMIQEALVMKVDVILRKPDAYGAEAFQRRRTVQLAPDLDLEIISAEDLVLAKLQWAAMGESDLQLRDARNLVQSVKGIDSAYLSKWATSLGVADLLERVTLS